MGGGTPGIVYIDDVFLGESEGTNLLVNADMEECESVWNVNGPFSIINLGAGVPNSTIAQARLRFTCRLFCFIL